MPETKSLSVSSSMQTNAILRELPADELAILATHLKPVALAIHYIFSEPGQEIHYCYFITSGMTSTVAVMQDGSSAEIGVIGSEGLVGFTTMLGVGTSQNLTIMQVSGEGYRLEAEKLRSLVEELPHLRRAIDRFIWSSLGFYAQCAACNRFHTLEERLSRWLLTVRDRIQVNGLPLTHEFLGQMLGAHRSTVTLALGVLESNGVIQNSRGKIELIDLGRLEKTSCECLQSIRKLPGFPAAAHNGHLSA